MSFFQNQDKVVALIFRLTLFFWLVTKLMSYSLWLGTHVFPMAPYFSFIPAFPAFLHYVLFGGSLLGLLFLMLKPTNRIVLISLIIIEIIQLIPDQNRWQPYILQFIFTGILFDLYRKKPALFTANMAFYSACLYLHSGLHKLNGGFLFHVWERMILHQFLGFDLSIAEQPIVHYSGLALGVFEVIGAIGVLFARNKFFYAWILVGMHIFILLFISPSGIDYNSIVWPWNILMMAILPVIFYHKTERAALHFNLKHPKTLLLGLFLLILPFLSFFDYYDNFLAFNLYSGRLKQFDICVGKPDEAPDLRVFETKKRTYCDTKTVLQTNVWHIRETNTVVYPEIRVYRQIADSLKMRYPKAELSFCIYQYPYKAANIIYFD